MNLDLELQLFMELSEGGLPCVWQPLVAPPVKHCKQVASCIAPLYLVLYFPPVSHIHYS